jgi:hypothetical protein
MASTAETTGQEPSRGEKIASECNTKQQNRYGSQKFACGSLALPTKVAEALQTARRITCRQRGNDE